MSGLPSGSRTTRPWATSTRPALPQLPSTEARRTSALMAKRKPARRGQGCPRSLLLDLQARRIDRFLRKRSKASISFVRFRPADLAAFSSGTNFWPSIHHSRSRRRPSSNQLFHSADVRRGEAVPFKTIATTPVHHRLGYLIEGDNYRKSRASVSHAPGHRSKGSLFVFS